MLGYLIPEFPGTTHTFFQRELKALEALGVQMAIVSTRRPKPRFRCHGWTEELMARTTYLAPLQPRFVLPVLGVLLRAGPRRWWQCWKALSTADDLKTTTKLKKLMLLPFAAELVAWARSAGLSHIHSHFCADGAHVAMFAYLLGGPSYSISLHGALDANGGNQRNKWRHAKFGIAVTRTLLESARTEIGDAAPSTWAVAPMGVETSIFRRAKTYMPYDGDGPLRIFSCGRLNVGKAPDDLLRATAHLVGMGLQVSLRIAGEDDSAKGDYKSSLRALAAELGIDGRVALLGAMPEEKVREELEHAHVFALASLHEALGVATMEAMAMGVPAIATRVGGVPELIEDGVHGLLVEPRAPERLAEALLRVATDPGLALALSAAGRARVEEHFHTRKSADALLQLFRGLTPETIGAAPLLEPPPQGR